MDFRVEYQQLSFGDFLALNRLQRRIHHKWRTRLIRGFAIVFGGLSLAGMLWVLAEGLFSPLYILSLVLSLLFLVIGLFWDYLNASQSRRLALKTPGPVTISCDDEGVLDQSGAIQGFYPYAAITALYYRRSRYFLYLDQRHALILPEDKFTYGDPAAFGDYISAKGGMPLRRVK